MPLNNADEARAWLVNVVPGASAATGELRRAAVRIERAVNLVRARRPAPDVAEAIDVLELAGSDVCMRLRALRRQESKETFLRGAVTAWIDAQR